MSNIESVFKYKGSSDNAMKMISIWLTFCIVDNKIGLILDDTWNNIIVDKKIYMGYVNKFK